jgi:hypothetical protein
MTEGIIAHFANEGASRPQPGGCDGDIGRRPTWLGIKCADLRKAFPDLGREHIDQEFSQANQVYHF